MSHKLSVFFLQKLKKMDTKKKFYIIAFDPIRIYKHLAPQNDLLLRYHPTKLNITAKDRE